MLGELVFEQGEAQTLHPASKALLCSLCGEFYNVLSWKNRRCKQEINIKKKLKKRKKQTEKSSKRTENPKQVIKLL